jgi:hypothetical protein
LALQEPKPDSLSLGTSSLLFVFLFEVKGIKSAMALLGLLKRTDLISFLDFFISELQTLNKGKTLDQVT